MDYLEEDHRRRGMMESKQLYRQDDVPTGGGLMGRFENVRQKKSAKAIIACDAATAEYLRHDYLKPQHLPIERVDEEANFIATSNINETRFHKGFHRKHRADIQSDAARLEVEAYREYAREDRAQACVDATREFRARNTFNILTGEGIGRESEFRQLGKKILNPYGCMEAVYADHDKEDATRIKNSKHRFFQHNAQRSEERAANIFHEGLNTTVRETAILGYGQSGVRRARAQSCGVADNFAHLRALPPDPNYEAPRYGNYSQIVLG